MESVLKEIVLHYPTIPSHKKWKSIAGDLITTYVSKILSLLELLLLYDMMII